MTAERGAGPFTAADDAPEASLHARRRISPIWAIPIVALLIAGWLGYTAWNERGTTITLTFRSGAGLEAGKTLVKHDDVQLGTVETVDLSADLSRVVVTARMDKATTRYLTAGTRFWVVRPRLSLQSFSGLETLVSGAYIEMDPGTGAAARRFTGLEDPPVVNADVPGREFILTTDRLGSVGPSSPIFYRSVQVGSVLGYEFSADHTYIRVHAFVRSPYDTLVFPSTQFWNDSGVSVTASATGVKFEVESLQAVLSGGIAFETPTSVQVGTPAAAGAQFQLYPDHAAVLEAGFAERVPFIVEFDDSVHGLEVGAPVEFRGIQVGDVTDIRILFDPKTGQVRIPVTINFEPQRIQSSGFLPNAGSSELDRITAEMNALVARGMRAQLRTASLLTGQLFVAFDFYPNAPPAKMVMNGPIAQLPTVPSDLESLALTANDLLARMGTLLDRVNSMPIEQSLNEARGLMQSVRALTDAPELKDSVRTLDKTLVDADGSLDRLDTLIDSTSRGYGGDSQVRHQLVDLLRQLQDTAKSVQLLADYVEQHPDAVIRGKKASAQ